MLILSRREGEELVLTYEGITIRVKGGRVKGGVEAPQEVDVVRREFQAREPMPCDIAPLPNRADIGAQAVSCRPLAFILRP